MKITEWCLVDGDDTAILMHQVRLLIANGWQPYGEVRMVSEAPYRRIWFQAMVKYERISGTRAM